MRTILYNAPAPKIPLKEKIKKIAWRVVIPPILLWDVLKLGMNKAFGAVLGKLIVPMTRDAERVLYANWNFETDAKYLALYYPKITVCMTSITTHDGVVIDGMEFKLMNAEKYIINVLANGTCYEDMIPSFDNFQDMAHCEMLLDMQTQDCNVIVFNYRNVGRSTGTLRSQKDLVTDTIAQVQRLLDNNVLPQMIFLKGSSIGGAVGTLVAYHFHKLGITINCFDILPFSNITNTVVGTLRAEKGINTKTNRIEVIRAYTETTKGKIKGTLAYPVIKLVLLATSWDINIVKPYSKLPAANKQYLVAKSPRAVRESSRHAPRDDTIITYYASLHLALKKERTKEKAALDSRIKIMTNRDNMGLLDFEAQQELKFVQSKRAQFKECKVVAIKPHYSAHNLPLTALFNRLDNTPAQNVFWKFLNKDVIVADEKYAEDKNSSLRRRK